MHSQPKYVQSKRGKRLLAHNSFTYTLTHPLQALEKANKRWKCSYSVNGRYVCKAKARTFMKPDGTETVEYEGDHCHQ